MSASTHGITGRLLIAAAALFIIVGQAAAQVRGPQRPEIRGVLKSADQFGITVSVPTGREAAKDNSYPLAKNVEVAVGGGFAGGRMGFPGMEGRPGFGGPPGFGPGGFGGAVFKEAKVTDLPAGITVTITLSEDKKVESITAEEPVVRAVLKSVDAANKTLTVGLAGGRGQPGEEKTFTLAADAEIAVDDGRGRRFSVREGKLADLVAGSSVTVRLSLDGKQALCVSAEGPMLGGVVKAIDPAAKTLTLHIRPPRGEDAGEEKTLTIGAGAVVVIDDGRGRRLSVKEAKLSDVPVGASAVVRLSADQSSVMFLRAEGQGMMGLLKAVDAEKGTVTIAIPRGRDEPEKKTFPLAKDARILIDGVEAKLADLKPADNGPVVILRLTLDRSAVQFLMTRPEGRR